MRGTKALVPERRGNLKCRPCHVLCAAYVPVRRVILFRHRLTSFQNHPAGPGGVLTLFSPRARLGKVKVTTYRGRNSFNSRVSAIQQSCQTRCRMRRKIACDCLTMRCDPNAMRDTLPRRSHHTPENHRAPNWGCFAPNWSRRAPNCGRLASQAGMAAAESQVFA